MPGPVVHHLLTEFIYNNFLTNLDFSKFVKGSYFPDIRAFAAVSREITHDQKTSFSDYLNEENIFLKGFKLHSFIDRTWTDYFLEKTDNKRRYLEIVHLTASAKLAQEILVYKDISNINKMVKVYDKVGDDELLIINDRELITKWYKILQKYLATNPNKKTIKKYLLLNHLVSDQQSEIIINNIDNLLSDNFFVQITFGFIDYFKSKIK